ncbi:MAG: glycine cleavage system protein H [Actinomycetota bacterium]|nr:MAG: gcvH5H [Acidimicrobiaceae bacterium]
MSDEHNVRGFKVRLDRAYHLDFHLWVQSSEGDSVRIGMDPLGLETSGTLSQLEFAAVGTIVARGEPFGTLEAEKFVGPIRSPLSGMIVASNAEAMASPGICERDPYGEGWFVELTPFDFDGERDQLTEGTVTLVAAFAAKVDDYRRQGVLAE